MSYTNTESEWGTVAKTLHWLIGILIVIQLVMGWLFTLRAFEGPFQVQLVLNVHIPLGVTVLGLAALRLLWRFGNDHPQLPKSMSWWEMFLASGSHTYLYMAMIVMPLSGWIATNAFGSPVTWFAGIALPTLAAVEAKETGRPLTSMAAQIHFWIAAGLSAVVIAHVVGALRHHFSLKDIVLARMAPKGWVKAPGA
ncbi:MAG: cytochrome b [Rhodospirillaceae bacterium]|nr:cytochrome b [Rhodospirillaceae bacterium]